LRIHLLAFGDLQGAEIKAFYKQKGRRKGSILSDVQDAKMEHVAEML